MCHCKYVHIGSGLTGRHVARRCGGEIGDGMGSWCLVDIQIDLPDVGLVSYMRSA